MLNFLCFQLLVSNNYTWSSASFFFHSWITFLRMKLSHKWSITGSNKSHKSAFTGEQVAFIKLRRTIYKFAEFSLKMLLHEAQCHWKCVFFLHAAITHSNFNLTEIHVPAVLQVKCLQLLCLYTHCLITSHFLAVNTTFPFEWLSINAAAFSPQSLFISTVSSCYFPARCTNQISCKATVEMIGSNCNECLCLLTAVLICEPCTKQSIIDSLCV